MRDGKGCCYGCTERVVGCHSTCEKYIAQKQRDAEIKEKERIFNETNSACAGLHTGRQWKYQKSHRSTSSRY